MTTLLTVYLVGANGQPRQIYCVEEREQALIIHVANTRTKGRVLRFRATVPVSAHRE